jgi:4'-phosphopantetheinyl transferase
LTIFVARGSTLRPLSSGAPFVDSLLGYSSRTRAGNLGADVEASDSPDFVACDVYVAALSSLRRRHVELLDSTEVARWHRYLRREDGDRFVLGAVLLRAVVGHELRRHPRDLLVDRTCGRCEQPHGRPRIVGARLEASVSHSGDLVAVAVTRAGMVGVDIEQMKPFDHRPLLVDVCAEEERAFAADQAAFYTYWTRKEAYLKATGDGLLRPMADVRITPPGSPPAVLHVGRDAAPPTQMFDLRLMDGYVGAVAVLTPLPLRYRARDAARLVESR